MNLFVTPHALARVRKHWPHTSGYSDRKLIGRMCRQIRTAIERGESVKTPGGIYVPLSLEGDDGYAVLRDTVVVTALPRAWCPQVEQVKEFF